MDPARYLTHTVWDRGNRFALFSATILDKDAFCRQVGLDPSTVALVDVPHTFPLEHRPVYDVTQGKMTYDQRSKTLPAVARVIVRIMQAHQDEKGLVHAHSYAIQEQLCEHFEDFGVGDRIRAHTRDDRDGALEDWKATDEPTVFCSVKMEEALDLKDDYCRWQVICKAPFLNTSDSRVAHRLEEGNWAWYYRSALRTVIQACGRVVRSPDDYGVTYLADESLLDLFDRARGDLPPWFAEQVDHLERPDLPPFDPAEAISIGEPGASGERNADILNRGDTTRERSRNRPRRSRSGGGSDSKSPSRNRPLSDVWDVE